MLGHPETAKIYYERQLEIAETIAEESGTLEYHHLLSIINEQLKMLE